MDRFVFRTIDTDQDMLKIPDIDGESQMGTGEFWIGDGAMPRGMHVDPVIPGGTGFEDPSFGFTVPLGFDDPGFG
ncbi:hypothetical protein [Pukyongiella litopenaei]|uniref:Uncharacterized protein n=1 Tax=Pukyongiella litopenaei TaxID=2605946 RepID=A0A2S0MKZ9_9RHOB|nr:hypothetical protein [Pukyongiella litopenaei]AVO36560.1 hypothetical protein C6Y53_01815 [Pukyongiella litopenaei]